MKTIMAISALTLTFAASACSSADRSDEGSTSSDALETSSLTSSSSDCELIQGPASTETVDRQFPGRKTMASTAIGKGPGCDAKCQKWADQNGVWSRPNPNVSIVNNLVTGITSCSLVNRDVPIALPSQPCQLVESGRTWDLPGPYVSPVKEVWARASGAVATGYGDEQACAYACGQWRTQYLQQHPEIAPKDLFTDFAPSWDGGWSGQYVCRVGQYKN